MSLVGEFCAVEKLTDSDRSASVNCIPWVYVPEILPLQARAKGRSKKSETRKVQCIDSSPRNCNWHKLKLAMGKYIHADFF